MALPTPTKPWVLDPQGNGLVLATVNLTGASQVSDYLYTANYWIESVHIYGADFNSQTVSVKGFNGLDADSTPQNIHQKESLGGATGDYETFTNIGAEVLATPAEHPQHIVASSDGAVADVVVAIMLRLKR